MFMLLVFWIIFGVVRCYDFIKGFIFGIFLFILFFLFDRICIKWLLLIGIVLGFGDRMVNEIDKMFYRVFILVGWRIDSK